MYKTAHHRNIKIQVINNDIILITIREDTKSIDANVLNFGARMNCSERSQRAKQHQKATLESAHQTPKCNFNIIVGSTENITQQIAHNVSSHNCTELECSCVFVLANN